jgi:iron complex transport system ATP-binding protein
MLEVQNLTCGYAGKSLVENVNFRISNGETLVLLGPNGIGKTTLFKTMLGLIPKINGEVLMDGSPLDMKPDSTDMRRIAYVPQEHESAFAFTVVEIVLMGRTAKMQPFATPSSADKDAVRNTLRTLGLDYLQDCFYTEISGGERQMVLIARALVQEPDVLVMDEPAASLDLGNQAKLLRIVRDLSRDRDLSVLMTSHNPDHALAIADKVLLLRKGGFVHGTADEILNGELLSEAYGTEIEIIGNDLRSCVLKV